MTSTQRVRSADGTELAVYDSGDVGGPTLVAIHGYPDDHTVWDGLVDELSPQLRVVTYDVRGAGASDAPRDTAAYRMDRLMEDLAAVLDAVSPDRPVHLIGHDSGSVQGWSAAADERFRNRILSYVSISGPSLEHLGPWLRDVHRHPIASAKQAAHSYYTLLFQLPKLPEAAIRAGVVDRAAGSRNHHDQELGLSLYRANLRAAVTGRRPRRVPVPVLVLAPDHDPYITVDAAVGAPQQHVGDLRTRVLTGGHWIVRDRPEVVADSVREFIDHIEGAPETRALRLARRRPEGTFAGTLTLVTGGARGIGRATALEFARAGADVIIADIDDLAAKHTVHELTVLGVQAHAYHLDVRDAAAWEQFAEQVRRDHGTPDVVVNNAGIGMSGPLLKTGVADWQRVLDVNLWGVIHGCRLFGQQLVRRGQGGHIVNIASAAGYAPSVTLPAYATSKAAVLMLTECLRAELAPGGVGVTAICPGFVDSDITRSARFVGTDEAGEQALRERAAAAYTKRNYQPERVARQIVRAAARNTAVQPVTVEAHVLRLISRFAPPVARRLARLDLAAL